MFGIVGTLIIADIILLIPPTAVSSARFRREQEEFEGNKVSILLPNNLLSSYVLFIKQPNDLPAVVGVCTSDSSLIWLSFIFACKGCVLSAGLFLAFGTRRVKITALNDSRFIVMSVYGIVIVSIVLTPIGFLLQHYPNAQYGITGMMILLSTSLILGLVFVTKVLRTYSWQYRYIL